MKPKTNSASNTDPRLKKFRIKMRSKRNSKSKSNAHNNQLKQIKKEDDKCSNSSRQSGQHNRCHIPSKATNTGSGFTCSGCDKLIKGDKSLFKACDQYWHESCLKCDRCQAKLGELGNTFYCKSNMHLCRHDYFELFGHPGICSVCDKTIRAYEMVMRANSNVYHLECFACQLCNLRFCVGERFYLCENKIVCQYDYEEQMLDLGKGSIADELTKPMGQFGSTLESNCPTVSSDQNQLCDLDQAY